MATLNVIYRIGADIAGLSRDMNRAADATERLDRRMQSAGRVARTAFAGVGLAAIGRGISEVVSAAADFESSFTGIEKTVEATEEQFAALSIAVREMSTEIPIGVNELNNIGEAAGQLGIEVENLESFIRVMADLGVATQLHSVEAATALAQLGAITGLPQTEFGKLSSSIVHLGNTLETTERQIIEFALRIAGVGRTAGLSQAEIIGIGGAFASVGVQAEAGGTAIQKVLISMIRATAESTSVIDGQLREAFSSMADIEDVLAIDATEALETFAETAGVTVEEFATLFQDDAAGAFTAFVEGLEANGGRAFALLNDLKLGNERVTRAFTSLSGAGGKLNKILGESTVAFFENTAATIEAERRYATFQSMVARLGGTIKDLAVAVTDLDALKGAVGNLQRIADAARDSGLQLQTFKDRWLELTGNEIFPTPFAPLLDRLQALNDFLFDTTEAIGAVGIESREAGNGVAELAAHFVRFRDVLIGGGGGGGAGTNDAVETLADRLGRVSTNIAALGDMLIRPTRTLLTYEEALLGAGQALAVVKDGTIEARNRAFIPFADVAEDLGTTVFDFGVEAVKAGNGVMDLADAFEVAEVEGQDFGGVLRGITTSFDAFVTGLTGGQRTVAGFFQQLGSAFVQQGLGRLLNRGVNALFDLAGGFFNAITGGPSAAELEAREMVEAFTNEMTRGLTDAQMDEAALAGFANLQDAALVVAVRDIFLAAGRTAEEGIAAVSRLWDAIKGGGPEAVQAAIEHIQAVAREARQLEEIQQGIADTQLQLTNAVQEREALLQQALQDGVAAFQVFQDSGLAAGVAVPRAFRHMLEAARLLTGELTGPLIQGAVAGGQALSSLVAIGQVSQRNFTEFGAAITDAFTQLLEGGASSAGALEALRQPLGALLLAQQTYGFEVDEGTQALLDLATQHGITAADGETAAMRQIQALDRVIEVLEEMLRIFEERLPAAITSLPDANVHVNVTSDPFPNTAEVGGELHVPSFQHGTRGQFLDFGAGTLAMLHGRERVVPQGEALGGTTVVHVDARGALLPDLSSQRELVRLISEAVMNETELDRHIA